MSKVNYACDVVLYSELESRESHEAYEVPADHIRVKRDPLDLRIARYQVTESGAGVTRRGHSGPRVQCRGTQ
jgi:hypothetical protein